MPTTVSRLAATCCHPETLHLTLLTQHTPHKDTNIIPGFEKCTLENADKLSLPYSYVIILHIIVLIYASDDDSQIAL